MTSEISLDRKFLISMNGSFALSFAPQVLLNKEEYLNHVNELLNKCTHSENNKRAHLQYLYEAFVISLLSFLEYITGDACNEIGIVMNQKIRINHINERSKFEGAETYLHLLIDEQFPSNNIKLQLKKYRKVRNRLIHNIYLTPSNEKEIRSLSDMKGVVVEDEMLYLSREFCNEMVKFSEEYIHELTVIAKNISERAELFAKKS